jgi:hypothetical protein
MEYRGLLATVAVLVAFAVSGCALLGFGTFDHDKWNQGVDLSRTAFIREMVISEKTETTAHFDDYTPGAYHVRKMDLIEGVRTLSDSTTRFVDAVLIAGPAGPLWQYEVLTIIDSARPDGRIIVNDLIFPHARITYKASGLLDRSEYESTMNRILSNPLLRDPAKDTSFNGEWETSLLVARFGEQSQIGLLPYSVGVEDSVELKMLYDAVNDLIAGERSVTYD